MNDYIIEIFGDSLTYLVSISAALTAIIPLMAKPGQIFNRTYKWYKRIRGTGYIIIAISALGIYFNILQNTYNDQKNEEKETKLKESLNKSYKSSLDTMRNNFTNSSKEIINVVVSSLGKYGFKADSANRRLVRIVRDSSKTKIVMPTQPVVRLCPDSGISLNKRTKNEYIFNSSFCSLDAGSRKFNFSIKSVYQDSLGILHYGGNAKIFPQSIILYKDSQFKTTFGYKVSVGQMPKIVEVYLYVIGTYENLDGSKIFPLDELYVYNLDDNTFRILSNEKRDEIVNFIKSR